MAPSNPAMRTIAAACAAALLGTASVLAALPPEAYVELRREAVHHVQLRIRTVAGLPWYTDHGACRVRGEVVRVFKGDHQVGDRLELDVDCAKPRARLPDGAALWTSARALADASHIEAYLDADGAVAGWQTVLLSEPSDEPACPDETDSPC